MAALFISFEGVEGSGKTTQIALLRDALAEMGLDVYLTREPGGDPVAESIRSVLLSSDREITPISELLLFLAARAQVTAKIIRPALESGKTVLCDRYIDSTAAYQGHARGNDLDSVYRLNEMATGGLTPDLTILLDLDPGRGLARQGDRNRMEAEPLEFHRKVRQGFLEEARKNPTRFRVIDAAQTPESVHAEIMAAVRPLLTR
jgi:dTMP kinase